MTWREAFLTQARGDAKVHELLNRTRVEYSHQLHYLQMVTEKLAKALMCTTNAPPATSHAAFVRGLQHIKARPEIRRKLGYTDSLSFHAYINSLLPLAYSLERLAPNFAGLNQPNPEYPWQSTPNGPVIAPVDFDFADFNPSSPQMAKLAGLIRDLVRILD